ncbi:uncharacterized protein LOC107044749 isoform X2 [Diachasma alloeum]|uniref:uncharacterized protein LOC107044749 isoform X2 n=1 Tax=Diachasma alloeum TaxID=454923 RepID=UPI0007381765|nr:uncharacterized protein LOC107044749 isoform X2 [Diachasma alloeum]XP_015122255.1 uncharacterized protein LOC107044749 isoform X2 [Diachasma alloeum]
MEKMSKGFNDIFEQMQRLFKIPNERNDVRAPDPMNADPLNLGGEGEQNEQPDGEQPRNATAAVIENLVRFLQGEEQQQQQQQQQDMQRELLRAIMVTPPRTAEEFFEVLRTFIEAQNRRKTRRGTNAGVSR